MTPDVAMAYAFLFGLMIGAGIAFAGVWVGFCIMRKEGKDK